MTVSIIVQFKRRRTARISGDRPRVATVDVLHVRKSAPDSPLARGAPHISSVETMRPSEPVLLATTRFLRLDSPATCSLRSLAQAGINASIRTARRPRPLPRPLVPGYLCWHMVALPWRRRGGVLAFVRGFSQVRASAPPGDKGGSNLLVPPMLLRAPPAGIRAFCAQHARLFRRCFSPGLMTAFTHERRSGDSPSSPPLQFAPFCFCGRFDWPKTCGAHFVCRPVECDTSEPLRRMRGSRT
jgi:hypothetical protein